MQGWLQWMVCGWLLSFAPAYALQARSAAPTNDAFDAWLKRGLIVEMRLEVSPEAEDKLRAAPREWVPFTLRVDGRTVYTLGGLKLKGAAGSFQDYDARPAFTIKLDKFAGQEDKSPDAVLFHGLEKFHLNNSVQDESLLSEWLCSEIFREAGYPATRVTHVRVHVNQRDMGVYVFKEGFDKRFLKRWFPGGNRADGNLYDGGFCMDVDEELERDAGKGPEDRADLQALAAAATDSDLSVRWQRLPELVELEPFVRFMALELMLGHWDGYSGNRNNYRLYFEPQGKAYFLPHGMDQCFQDAGASVLDMPMAHVARSVMKNPAWRAQYRREVAALLPIFDAKRLGKKLDEVQRRLQPALKAVSDEAAALQAARSQELRERLGERERSLKEQKSQPDPKPLVFKTGVGVLLKRWHPMSEVDDAEVREDKLGATEFLCVTAGPSGRCIAGWRSQVLLSRGRYKLSAQVQTQNVTALDDSTGAALRLSGQPGTTGVLGTATRTLDLEFEVSEETADLELVLELRAKSGTALFRKDSLRLTKLADAR